MCSCSWLSLPSASQISPFQQQTPPATEEELDPDVEAALREAEDMPDDLDEQETPPTNEPTPPAEAATPPPAPPPAPPEQTPTAAAPLVPTPEQQAAAIKLLQEEIALLRAANKPQPHTPAAPPIATTPPTQQEERPAATPYSSGSAISDSSPSLFPKEQSAAQRHGLREPSLPSLLPMDIDGKIHSSDDTH